MARGDLTCLKNRPEFPNCQDLFITTTFERNQKQVYLFILSKLALNAFACDPWFVRHNIADEDYFRCTHLWNSSLIRSRPVSQAYYQIQSHLFCV